MTNLLQPNHRAGRLKGGETVGALRIRGVLRIIVVLMVVASLMGTLGCSRLRTYHAPLAAGDNEKPQVAKQADADQP